MNDAVPHTVGETYFFRDRGQFDLLRLQLLPELIERRRAAKTLRLWSAGCSKGEEAYSLAMLVDMLLPAREGWNILILGSDIDPAALEKARRGRYGKWSFRMMPDELLRRFFRREGDEWALDERIRDMVRFRAHDLIGDPFPCGELQEMDLILCRNVFIYFQPEEVGRVGAKLAATLGEGGYLLTGHTELMGHVPRTLHSRMFAESVVYQKGAPLPLPHAPDASRTPPSPQAPKTVMPPPPSPAGPVPGEASPVSPGAQADLFSTARILADQGRYEAAEQACRKALDAHPLDPGGYFLLAQLAQIGGDFVKARELLNKALYLDPRDVAATLELAALEERAGDLPRAQILRRAALAMVRALPPGEMVEPYETTAAELAKWLAT